MTEQQQLLDPGPKVPPTPDFHVSVELKTSLTFDLKRFFQNRLDQYLAYELEDGAGYEPWEKPMSYLHYWIDNESDSPMYWTTDKEVVQGFDDIEIDTDRFTKEQALALHESLGLNEEGTERVTRVS